MPGGHLPHNLERPGSLNPGTGDALVTHGIPVHSRVGHGREAERCYHILGQHLPQGLKDGLLLGIQGSEVGDDALIGVLHAEHVLVPVAMAVMLSRHITLPSSPAFLPLCATSRTKSSAHL